MFDYEVYSESSEQKYSTEKNLDKDVEATLSCTRTEKLIKTFSDCKPAVWDDKVNLILFYLQKCWLRRTVISLSKIFNQRIFICYLNINIISVLSKSFRDVDKSDYRHSYSLDRFGFQFVDAYFFMSVLHDSPISANSSLVICSQATSSSFRS